MIKLAELLDEKKHMTPAQKKKRGEIYDKLVAGGMESNKAGAIATSKAIIAKAIREEMCETCGMEHGEHQHQDHEAQMAKGELRDMLMNGAKLYQMIQPGQNLPGWVSAYITLASDYMHSVAEYMTEKSISGDE